VTVGANQGLLTQVKTVNEWQFAFLPEGGEDSPLRSCKGSG
jgi:hypothetical protein